MDLAGALALIGTIGSLINRAQSAGLAGVSPLPYIDAAAHVCRTGVEKLRAIVAGEGPDFAAMTPEAIHDWFTPKTIAMLEAEARGEVGGGPLP